MGFFGPMVVAGVFLGMILYDRIVSRIFIPVLEKGREMF